ncbi:hypothetical protein [Aeromonas veronii]|uniref:hypothetical protein n=1 Tax=Aeromonas veronii TaxID=654 RepID=UPI003D19A771
MRMHKWIKINVENLQIDERKMSEKKYGSLRVSEERKMMLEKAAIEVSYATGKVVKWSEVAFYLIDEYLKEAVKDLKGKR